MLDSALKSEESVKKGDFDETAIENLDSGLIDRILEEGEGTEAPQQPEQE